MNRYLPEQICRLTGILLLLPLLTALLSLCGASQHDLKEDREITPRLTLYDYHRLPRRLAFSPDGRLLAVTDGSKPVKLWDTATGKERLALKTRGPHDRVKDVAFAPDGKIIALASDVGIVRLLHPSSGDEVAILGKPFRVTAEMRLAFSPNGQTIAVAFRKLFIGNPSSEEDQRKEDIIFWDIATRKIIKGDPAEAVASQLAFSLNRNWEVAFSPNGKLMAAADQNNIAKFGIGTLELRDLESGKVRVILEKPPAIRTRRVAFSPDGRTLAAARDSQMVLLWEIATAKRREYISLPAGRACELAWSPDGRTLATLEDNEDLIKLWDTYKITTKPPDASKLQRLWAVLAGDEGVIAQLLQTERDKAGKIEDKLMWAVQTGEKPVVAFWAIRTLVAYPERTLPFFHKHLRAAQSPPVPVERDVEGWLTDLGSESFESRQKAEAALKKCGVPLMPALRRAALPKGIALEKRRRIDAILEHIQRVDASQQLQHIRAVEVLEHIGTAEARAHLEELAKGVPEARLTQEAKASLARLQKRPLPKR